MRVYRQLCKANYTIPSVAFGDSSPYYGEPFLRISMYVRRLRRSITQEGIVAGKSRQTDFCDGECITSYMTPRKNPFNKLLHNEYAFEFNARTFGLYLLSTNRNTL